jgi:hypothetical protein
VDGVFSVIFNHVRPAVILVIRQLVWSDDLKARGVDIATALFDFLSARSLFSESERLLVTVGQLNLAVLYAFTSIAVSSMLPLLYRFATAFFIQSVLLIRGIDESDEDLLYFAVNTFGGSSPARWCP